MQFRFRAYLYNADSLTLIYIPIRIHIFPDIRQEPKLPEDDECLVPRLPGLHDVTGPAHGYLQAEACTGSIGGGGATLQPFLYSVFSSPPPYLPLWYLYSRW